MVVYELYLNDGASYVLLNDGSSTLLLNAEGPEAGGNSSSNVAGGSTIKSTRQQKHPDNYKLHIPVFGKVTKISTVPIKSKIRIDSEINTLAKTSNDSEINITSKIKIESKVSILYKIKTIKECNPFIRLIDFELIKRNKEKIKNLENVNKLRRIKDLIDSL